MTSSARFVEEGRDVVGSLRAQLHTLEPSVKVSRLGRVTEAGDGVATAVGLERPVAGELLDVAGVPARAEVVSEQEVKLVLLGGSDRVQAGDPVRRTGRVLDVPAGIELVGRIVDPLGRPIDGAGPLRTRRRVQVEGEAAPLLDREPVSRPLGTGVFVLDAMIPIGRGQRQLIVGDRSTGKTELCLDVLSALDSDMIGVYVSIGRRGADAAANLNWLRARGFFEHGFGVVAESEAPVGLVQLAPYAAMAMAEDLMNGGHDVLIVLDDLMKHAHAHRTLALLLGRPVGREAYPVDVFYAHARVLERSAQLSTRRGGGSLTALPIIETQAGDLTSYIPTNLVSITDGQVRLDAALVAEGQLPAVDVGLSVSRVGGKAQPALVRRLAGQFRNRYAQFLELEAFTRFGARVEAASQQVIDRGRRIRRALRQRRATPMDWAEIVVTLVALEDERVAKVPLEQIGAVLTQVRDAARSRQPQTWARIAQAKPIDDEDLSALRAVVGEILGKAGALDQAEAR